MPALQGRPPMPSKDKTAKLIYLPDEVWEAIDAVVESENLSRIKVVERILIGKLPPVTVEGQGVKRGSK